MAQPSISTPTSNGVLLKAAENRNGYLAEHGCAVVRVQPVLSPFGTLAFLDEPDVDEFVQVVVERAVVDLDGFFEFFRTHLPAVDEPIEDLVPGSVTDRGMHVEILLQGQHAVLGEQILRIRGHVSTRRTRLVHSHRVSPYDREILRLGYVRCSNATAFVVPFLGHNFGVGEEAGSILEALADTHGERMVFVREDDVTSAMIQSASVRWDLRIETYEDEAELVTRLRRFAGEIMHRERRGGLDRLG